MCLIGTNVGGKGRCDAAQYWSTVDEEIVGELTDGERAYSYCANEGSEPGDPPYTEDGPANQDSGNVVEAHIQNYGKPSETIVIYLVDVWPHGSQRSSPTLS